MCIACFWSKGITEFWNYCCLLSLHFERWIIEFMANISLSLFPPLSLSVPLCLYLSSVYLSLFQFPRLLKLITQFSDFHTGTLSPRNALLTQPHAYKHTCTHTSAPVESLFTHWPNTYKHRGTSVDKKVMFHAGKSHSGRPQWKLDCLSHPPPPSIYGKCTII